ncbi:hypothetical protein HMPREF1982_02127 [Clostridiales bacterium oral taxon 876 str. F0540]|nr:hypothetical protein HMPREF1982_02127 [Clostridiales bacterium oral taxon 876 str. F0540]
MNKYFNKALFYTEKKNILASMSAYGICYAIALFQFSGNFFALKRISKLSNITDYTTPAYTLNFMYFFFFAFCITTVVYSYMEKDKKYYFMFTQPYSRASIIVTKTISFIISIIVPAVIYGVISFLILAFNKSYLGSNFGKLSIELFLKLFCIIGILTLLSTLLQLFQMIFGKMIAGVIFPVIYVCMVFLSLSLMKNFVSKKISVLRTAIEYINIFLFSPGKFSIGEKGFSTLSFSIINYMDKCYFLTSIILLLISAVIVYGTLKLNSRIKAENTSDIFMFKFSEVIFKVIFSLIFTLIGSLFISGLFYYLYSAVIGMNYSTYLMNTYGIPGKESIEHTIYLVLDILWIPIFILVYKLFSKIMNGRRIQ